MVATVLTVYGIETGMPYHHSYRRIQLNLISLQQYLPFTVLKQLPFL